MGIPPDSFSRIWCEVGAQYCQFSPSGRRSFLLRFVAFWQETLKLPSTYRLIATNAMHPYASPVVSFKEKTWVNAIANPQTRIQE